MKPWASDGKPEQTGWRREELGRITVNLIWVAVPSSKTGAVAVLEPGFESSNALGGDGGETVRFRIEPCPFPDAAHDDG